MDLKEILEKYGCKVDRDPAMGYRITYKDRQMMVRDELLLSIGVPRRKYTHSLDCSYHIDNYNDDSWRLPYPPYCDCPWVELEPTTEQDILNIIVRNLRIGR